MLFSDFVGRISYFTQNKSNYSVYSHSELPLLSYGLILLDFGRRERRFSLNTKKSSNHLEKFVINKVCCCCELRVSNPTS
jgi:hypothetical protein